MDEKILKEDFIIKWSNKEYDSFFKNHILYKEELMEDLLNKSN